MADIGELNPARIKGLRDPARYDQVNPNRIWEIVEPLTSGVDIHDGAGVGYMMLPFARSLPQATACDLRLGMLALLAEAAQAEALGNIECRAMVSTTQLPLTNNEAEMMGMLQVHHHLDDPRVLLNDSKRVLAPGGKSSS